MEMHISIGKKFTISLAGSGDAINRVSTRRVPDPRGAAYSGARRPKGAGQRMEVVYLDG